MFILNLKTVDVAIKTPTMFKLFKKRKENILNKIVFMRIKMLIVFNVVLM